MYTSTHTIISFILFLASILSYYVVLYIWSNNSNNENFNNFEMLFTSRSFYYSSFLMICICILFDVGSGKILKLFNYVKDPTNENDAIILTKVIKSTNEDDEGVCKIKVSNQ